MQSKCIKPYQKITRRSEFPPCKVSIRDGGKDLACSVGRKPEKQENGKHSVLKENELRFSP